MRHEIKDGILEIWQTGSKNNDLILVSNNIRNTKRSDRFNVYDYLLNLKSEDVIILNTIEEIEQSFGKFIRFKDVPQRIEFGNYKTDVSIKYLKDTMDDYVSDYNLDLNPNFQRGHVWTNEQRVKFVEFMLEGGKCSPILFNHNNWMKFREGNSNNRFVIVDGLQRLTSLLMFVNDELEVFNGFKYSEFDNVGFNVQVYVNDLKTEKEVLKWYLQVNEGGTPHTKEELDKVKRLLEEVND